MKTISLVIGRMLFALPMIIFGLFHFLYGSDMASQILRGWPLAIVFVYISGLGLLLAGVSILIQKYTHIACWLLAVELLLIIAGVHIPAIAYAADMSSTQMAFSAMLKDIALIGGALVIASTFKGKEV